MALQRSGIEYVAQGAPKFLSDVRKINRELEKQAGVGAKAARAVNDADKAIGNTAGSARKTSDSFGKLNTGLGSIVGKLPGLNQLLGGAGLLGGLLAASQAAIEFGRVSLDSFQQFETAAAEVFTLLPDLGQQGIEGLTDQIQAFSLETGRTTDQIIPALYQALSAGVPQDNVFEFLETALAASKGGVTDLETSVDAISSVLNAYNLDVSEAGRVSDALFTAVRLGKTTFEELGRSIFNVTPTASALGIEIETVSAALAALTAAGVPTTVATTQLRALLDELAKSGSKAATAFEQVAGQSFDKFIANGGTLAEALGLLNGEAERLDTPLKNLFSSTEAGSAALLLATTGAENFAGALVEMESATGATEAAAGRFADTLLESQKAADAAGEALRLYTGERLAPLRQGFNEAKTSVIEFLLEWQKTADASRDNSVEALKAADSLRGLGDIGREVADILDGQFFDTASERASAYTATLELLRGGFDGTAQQAIDFANALAEANEIARFRTGEESGPLTLDAQLAAQTAARIEEIGSASEAATTQVIDLTKEIGQLQAALQKISESSFSNAESIIGQLVGAETESDIQAQIERLQQNRRSLVADLISESSDLTFDQEIDLQLAFGEISLEEAELLRVEQQFFEVVNSLFGAESVIQLDDRALSIGSLIVQNSGADVAAQITDQIEALVGSGQGAAVDAAIEVVPQLVASGQLAEDAVGAFVTDLLGGIQDGLTVDQAVEVAIKANTADAETAIDSLQSKSTALSDGEYSVDTSTNAGDTQTQIDSATESANTLDGTDPDVTVSTNAGQAKGEIDAVTAAINAIRTEIIVNIRANRIGNFSSAELQAGAANFMSGGFTGGRRGQIAGLVHGEELVIPANVLDGGPLDAIAFMMANTPVASFQSPATQNFSTINNVTNVTNNNQFDNSRSLTTGDISTQRELGRLRHDLLGDHLG